MIISIIPFASQTSSCKILTSRESITLTLVLKKLLYSNVFIFSKWTEIALLEISDSTLFTALTSPRLAKKVNDKRSRIDKTRRIS